MKDEIIEILDRFNFVKKEPNKLSYYPEDLLTREEMWLLYDYITNLQEKSNNQAEEINRLYKQREKFMKKYGYLKEEKDKYKNVFDKIREYCKKERNNILANFEYLETTDLDNILELLEEVE